MKTEDLIASYSEKWMRFSKAVVYTNFICDYLNRVMTKKYKDKKSTLTVEQMCYKHWQSGVVDFIRDNMKGDLITSILRRLQEDRESEIIDPTQISLCLESLVTCSKFQDSPLSLYQTEFEEKFLRAQKKFYAEESRQVLKSNSIVNYSRYCIKRLDDEAERIKQFCHASTIRTGVQNCENVLVAEKSELLQGDFKRMLESFEIEHMAILYNLLSRCENGIKPLLYDLEAHVSCLGKDIIEKLGNSKAIDPVSFVFELSELHSKYFKLIETAFQRDVDFETAIDKAFRSFINNNSLSKSYELIAKFSDLILRKSKKRTEFDFEQNIVSIVKLFRYLDDKDMFQRFYSKYLAKRIINNQSLSNDYEEESISRLKAVCGYEYTSKLQKMFLDSSLSEELNQRFQDHCKRAKHRNSNFLVLTSGAWPISTDQKCEFQLPLELDKEQKLFEKYYGSVHNGRKLEWNHKLSTVEMKLNFSDKNYEILMNTYHAVILDLFNNNDELSVGSIKSKTLIKSSDLIQSLKDLIELGLLLCENPESPKSIVRINSGFTHKRTKIKLQGLLQTDSPAEVENVRRNVEEDRKVYVQALIVRIMKSKKELSQNLLIEEIIEQGKVYFVPSISLIKKTIDILVEKQFISRSESKDVFVYES